MKVGVLFILSMAMGLLPLFSAPASGFSVVSPDRPVIWYNRSGDQVSQSLSWDAAKHELMLYLSYNSIQNLELRDQWYYDNFRLTFPEVRLNESTNSLYFVDKHGRHIALGHLEDGVFGNRAVLDDNVQLIVNRDNTIHASISSAGSAAKKPIDR